MSLAQVVIAGSWDPALHRAPCSGASTEIPSVSLCPFPPHSLSLK